MRDSIRLARRAKFVLVLATMGSIGATSSFAVTQTETWAGTAGQNWNNATHWSPTNIPNNGNAGISDYNVVIGAGSPAVLDIPVTIDALTINSGAQLTINPNIVLTLNGPTLTDNGVIQVDTLSAAASINFAANTTISGSGHILLNDFSPFAKLTSAAGVTVTQAAGHTIDGVGEIDVALVNNGTVNSNATVGPRTLLLQSMPMTNNNLFEATGGSLLNISGIAVTQGAAGVILADATSSVLINAGASVIGGTLTNGGGSLTTSTATFNNVTISTGSKVQVANGTVLTIAGGSLVNNGTIQVDNVGSNASINFTGDTTISGTGTIFLDDYSPKAALTAAVGATVTQGANNTINGVGEIDAALINNGTVNATGNAGDKVLLLQTNAKTNNKVFRASGGGVLDIKGITVTQAAGATISADNTSSISIDNGATIIGGTLSTVGGGVINTSTATFNAVTIASGSKIQVAAGTPLNIAGGTLVNNGLIQVDVLSSSASLNFTTATALSGSGSIFLDDYSPSALLSSPVGVAVTQAAAHTIYGVGDITAALTNNGIVNANQIVGSRTLTLKTQSMTNNNLFEATGGGILNINGITVTQGALGHIKADGSSSIALNSATILSGTIDAAAGGIVNTSTATLSNVTLSAGTKVQVAPGTPLTIAGGSLINNGLIQVDTVSSSASINFTATTALTGTGSIFIDSYSPDATMGTSAGATVTQASGHTIYGIGAIDAALINNGIVNANQTVGTKTLNLQTNPKTNNNIFEATGGGILNIKGIAVTQGAAGVISSDATSGLSINTGASIIGGTLTAATGSTINVSNATFNALTLSTGSTVVVAPSTVLNIAGGSFTDNGLIQVDALSSNASINFTTTTALNGTGSIFLDDYSPSAFISAPAGATITQAATHTIYGIGDINAGLINNGVVNANQTVGTKTLTLQSQPMTNNNLFEATGGGILAVKGITVTQGTNGQIVAAATSGITLSGAAAIVGGKLSGPGTVTATGATLTGVNIAAGTPIAIPASGSLTLNGGTVNNGAISMTGSLSLSGVTGTGTLAITDNSPGVATLPTGSGRSSVTSLSVAFGKLDITNNSFAINYGSGNPSPLTTIRGYLKSGYGTGGWTGAGIVSSTAIATTGHYGIAYADSIDGAAAGQILLKYDRFGDADLNNTVDFNDLLLLAKSYGATTGAFWTGGDFDYNGTVDFNDLLLLAKNYGLAALTAQDSATLTDVAGASFSADLTLAKSLVPEPTSVGMIVGLAALAARRSRRA